MILTKLGLGISPNASRWYFRSHE